MSLNVSTIKPDVDRIFELVKLWDEQSRRHVIPSPPAYERGAVTRFAHRLGRHPQSFWNLRGGKNIGSGFLTQIADALKVDVGEITLPASEAEDDADEITQPAPEAEDSCPEPESEAEAA